MRGVAVRSGWFPFAYFPRLLLTSTELFAHDSHTDSCLNFHQAYVLDRLQKGLTS